jgi:histidinol-phosphate aminotransferase
VNRVGLASALAALESHEFVDGVRRENESRRAWFRAQLEARGFAPLPSETNFVLVPVVDAPGVPVALDEEFGIKVRDTTAFGMPGHVRVSLGRVDEMGRVLAALESVASPARHAVAPGISH